MEDTQTGISIRYIRTFDIGRRESALNLKADMLVMHDARDVSTLQKYLDAYAFLHSRHES